MSVVARVPIKENYPYRPLLCQMLRERYENGAELPKSGVADREVVEADGTALGTANIWHKPTWQLGTKHSLGPWINIKA